VAEPVFPESQPLDVGLFEVIEQLAADGAVHDQIHMGEIAEQEREVQNIDGRAEAAEGTGGSHEQIDRTLLKSLAHLALAFAKLAAGIKLDLDAAVGPLLDEIRKLLSANHVRMVQGQGRCQLHRGLVLGRRRPGQRQHHQHCKT
jgi:hypothetical protein